MLELARPLAQNLALHCLAAAAAATSGLQTARRDQELGEVYRKENMLDEKFSRSERSLGYIISLILSYLNWGVMRALAMLSSWMSSRLAGEVGMQSPWLLKRAPRLLTLSGLMVLVIFAIGYSEFMKYGQVFLLLAITKL